jgi:CelD/BcsL family acetyltransferase involved in cellulose biosynthesis
VIRVIALGSLNDAQDVAGEWGRLHAEGTSDIFTSPAWCLAGWRAFPNLGTPLLLIATDSAGVFLGALPLTSGPHGLRWAASPLGDEHDVRVRRDWPTREVVSALVRAVMRAVGGCKAVLADVRPDGVLTGVIETRRGCPAPVVQLDDPDEEFGALACLPGWSRERRRTLRSARRRLELSGQLTVAFITDQSSLAAALPAFARTRLVSWAARGRLAELPAMDRHPRFPEFLADVGRGLAVEGRCLLARLDLDGESLAEGLFFRSPGVDLLYMSSYQSTAARFGPSHLLLAEAARMAVTEGVRVVELGRGDEPYKFALGAQPRYLRDAILTPQTLLAG